MADASLTEVPHLFPSQNGEQRRFAIYDQARSIERALSSASSSTPGAANDPERLRGSSSVSYLGDAVVTTCALVEETSVVSVALTQGSSAPIFVEIDLSNTTIFGTPAKVQCFDDGSSWILHLVDSKGIVLSVTLDTTWTPMSFSLLSIRELVETQHALISGAEMDESMVVFLSSTVLVVGLSPHILTVNLPSKHVVVWSEEETLQDMRSKQLGSIFTKAGDMLLGRLDEDDMVDMPPTAALCHAGDFIFSLHSDASIRRWRIANLRPVEVVTLKAAIPEPPIWSDSNGAVALCAQLYESVYALGIHVQTVGGDNGDSPCRLTVVYGPQDMEEDAVRSVLQLTVPIAATSLVGFHFAPERCRLTALYQSQESEQKGTILLTYPHSIVSIVSTEPEATSSQYTLDGVAASERARLSAFTVVTNGSSLEKDLNQMDAAFLKYLFRPAYPRGNASVTLASSCIRSAIRKLVPGHYSTDNMSVELETVRAMHEWRRLENRGGQSPARPASSTSQVATTPGGSIYDSYVEDEPETPEMDIDEGGEDAADDDMEQEREAQLEAHEQRWRTLLLTVWEEEESLREPLYLSSQLSSEKSTFILVRAGFSSVFKEPTMTTNLGGTWEELDKAAVALLECAEKSEGMSSGLLSTEASVYDEIAKASLVLDPGSLQEWSDSLCRLGVEALAQSEIGVQELQIAFTAASQDDILVWLQSVDSVFSLPLAGTSVLPSGADVMDDDPNETWSNRFAPVQTRLAACSLFTRCSDSVRRLRLGRFLLLSNIASSAFNTKDPIYQAVFREYLHSISVMWSCAQVVPMPSTVLVGRTTNVTFEARRNAMDSPPTKRISFGEHASSILVADNEALAHMTTALDARFIQISQSHRQDSLGADSPDEVVTSLVRICFDSTFGMAPSSALLELGALLKPSEPNVASYHPRIALRLLAPFYAYPTLSEDKDVVLMRKEALAECLLIEANALSQKGPDFDSTVDALRTKACDLLVAPSFDTGGQVTKSMLEAVFTTLRKKREAVPSFDHFKVSEVDACVDSLAGELQLLLKGDETPPETDIVRLCQLATVREIFLPLKLVADNESVFLSLEDLPRECVKTTAEILLRISDLLNRLSILERHTGAVGSLGSDGASESTEFLLGYIENAISDVQDLLPDVVCSSMTEYAQLWTLLFHHSIPARKWAKAYEACTKHPDLERRIACYRHLVIAMVDAGACSELVALCSVVSMGGETVDGNTTVDCVDFYELAAETLAEAKQGNLYSTDSSFASTDYLGCLYALHAVRSDWKRAAEAMDAKYGIALDALSGTTIRDDSLANPMNVSAAVKDLALTSLAASNALQLVDNPASRYFLSGEPGSYPILPVMAEEDPMSDSDMQNTNGGSKRGRDGQLGDRTSGTIGSDTSRLERFMTVAHLEVRAVRALALRTVMRDKSDAAAVFVQRMSHSPSVESDRAVIDQLSSLGYYGQAILLARAVQARFEETGKCTMLGGRGMFYDLISHILASYILPVAMNILPSGPAMGRPTLSQVRRTIEENERGFCFVLGETWSPIEQLPVVATGTAAMELVRTLTVAYTSAASPLALEVAEAMLDLDQTISSLPVWLEELLLGVKDGAGEQSPGLFSQRPTTESRLYSGDPTALVTLYMKRGMYVKACEVVSRILTGSGDLKQSRENRAPARLPEKGDIDFVPYETIDRLWALIDRASSDAQIGAEEKRELLESRGSMETALEKHFQLMMISEMGSRSARALMQ